MVGAVLDAFRPSAAAASAASSASHPASAATPADAAAAAAAAAASAAETSAFFRSRSTAAQHHALALLGRILHVDPTAIHAMRGAVLWELAYGPAFFFFGQVITKRWPGPIRVRASNLQMNLQFKDLLVVCCMWTHRTRSMAYRKGMFTGRRM